MTAKLRQTGEHLAYSLAHLANLLRTNKSRQFIDFGIGQHFGIRTHKPRNASARRLD